MNVAIIPARGGSTRIPRKNVKPFFGKPIIAYSIATAQLTGLFDRIYVSTDDPMIGIVARQAGASPLLRAPELCRNDVGTQEVARDVLLHLPDVRYACCIYATAPLMSAEDLKRGFAAVSAGQPFAYSVGPDANDAGQFYWGTRQAFMERWPLGCGHRVTLPADRVCDINSPEDWSRAEQLYDAMRRKK